MAYNTKYHKELIKHREILENWTNTYGDKGSEPQNIHSLKFMYDRWGERCINEEYDAVKKIKIKNTPKTSLKK